MATRSITIALEAKVSGLVAGFKTAQQAASDFGSRTQEFAEKNRESLEAVGKTGMVAGGALVAGFGLAVTKFASFDKAMSSVQAATHESAANMDLLREAAIRAGADTAFSAEESAQAIEEMAKAGVSTADILGGGLDGALALAAAGALSVGEAAETAASAMTQFGLAGSDIPHIADLLAAGAGKAQGSVHDLGMALNQAGLVANQTGLTIEETTGGLAAFASAGLVGSDAGTSFKSMLQRLNPQSKEAADLMADLGLSAYDSQGEFIGLSEYAGELQSALSDMSSEQRNAAMQTLFGADAVRAASVLYNQGAEGVQGWIDAVNDAGYAAETAALMQNNLAGDLEKLGGAMDTVFLQAGSGANDALRGLVQTAEDFVDMIGRIPGPVLSAVGMLGGLTGGALLLGGAFISLAPKAFETVGHFRALATEAPELTTRLGKVGRAAGIAAAAFVGFQILKELNNGVWAPTSSGLERIANSMVGAADSTDRLDAAFRNADWANGNSKSLMQGTIEGVDGIGGALGRIENKNWNEAFSSWGNGLLGFKDKWQALDEDLASVDTTLAGYVSSGNAASAAAAFKQIATDAEASGGSVKGAAEKFPEYLDSLRSMATSAGVALSEQDLLNWAMGKTPPAMEAAAASSEETAAALGEVGGEAEVTAASLEDIVAALFALGEINMSSRDSTAAFHESLRAMNEVTAAATAGTLGLGAVLNETATDFDLTTEAGAKANAAFQEVARAGMADVEAKAREGMGQPELQANLQGTYDSLIIAAQGMGIEGAAADTLARKVMGIPDDADTTAYFHDAAAKLAMDTHNQKLNGMDGRVVRTYLEHYETTFKDTVLGPGASPKPGGGVLLPKKATGGAIYGPGTGTSDTAGIFALSNGEHVLTAAEVQAMGGQAAVYQFRDQLKAGLSGYAGGGRVGREYSAPASVGVGASGGRVEKHYHTHVNAGPGLEQSYSQAIANKAVQRQQDIHAAYGI